MVKDMIGQTFGRLLVQSRGPNSKGDKTTWRCKCVCGTEKTLRAGDLRSGRTLSCGCLRSENSTGRDRSTALIPGTVYGKLTVIRRDGYIKNDAAWLCACACGGSTRAKAARLLGNITRSCGCGVADSRAEGALVFEPGQRIGKLVVVRRDGFLGAQVAWLCQCDCGVSHRARGGDIGSGRARSCGCSRSHQEAELMAFVQGLAPDAVRNTKKIIPPMEIDVYVPDKLAIELDGLYWHGEKRLGKKARNKMLTKVEMFEAAKIRSLTFFQDEWDYRRSAVEGYIRSILQAKRKIGARQCVIRDGGSEFVEQHHLQGSNPNSSYISLIYRGEIVATMGFCKATSQKSRGGSGVYELTRYCVGPDLSVAGGMSKLIAEFWRRHPDATRLISYADRRLSGGALYRAAGFVQGVTSKPSYYYYKTATSPKRLHRFGFRKDALIKKGWLQEGETEWQCMQRMKYDRVWDAGKVLWMLDRK